jgi:hypothetical protein
MIEIESESRFAERVRAFDDHRLKRSLEAALARRRRRGRSARSRAFDDMSIPVMTAEAEARQLTIEWRRYSATLEFGARAHLGEDGSAEFEHVPPPSERDLKRQREAESAPLLIRSAGELFDSLEASLSARVNGHHDRNGHAPAD